MKSETTMKRKIFNSILAALTVSALVLSCDPIEPASYTENFYRIATVNCVNGRASLKFDYTGENYSIDNFKTQKDLDRFELNHGDRIIAGLQYYAVNGMGKVTIQSATAYPVIKLEESRPSDTLNYDFLFNVLTLWDVKYPAIWAAGHLVNLAPIYYVPKETSPRDFYLYPMQMNKDTLELRMYSYIPDNDLAIRGYGSASQSWLCYDIASLRDSVADAAELNHRKQILSDIEKLNKDSIMIHIFQPDTLRGMLDTIYYERYPKVSVSIKIPFDF